MGLLSFLCWLWSSPPSAVPPTSLSPHIHLQDPACKPSPPLRPPRRISEYHDSHAPKRITFTLPSQVYAWLEAMAMLHNYGSVHKSIRDILAWASTGHADDMEWLFATKHEIPQCLKFNIDWCKEASVIAGSQCDRGAEVVMVDARLSDDLNAWISACVKDFHLGGPSAVLDTVCRCAIELHAADDIFESDETGHDLPATTAELYHDLGIIRHSPSHFIVRTGCSNS